MTGLSPVELQSYRLLLPALRSSEGASQRSDSLQLPVWEIQLWSQQGRARLDLMKHRPSNTALPAPAAKHLVPVALHGPMDLLQRTEIPGDAEVGVMTRPSVKCTHSGAKNSASSVSGARDACGNRARVWALRLIRAGYRRFTDSDKIVLS